MSQSTVFRALAEYRPASTQVLDMLIVGGGPAGTAAAFRAKELGLKAFLVDFDDILKRIRDYPKDKLILPDFGGGDRMAFPAGGDCVSALQFAPIDKDEMHDRWKNLYVAFDVPCQTALELSSIERDNDTWKVVMWDHKAGRQEIFKTHHLVLALGRGVPRRLEMAGNTEGIAYRMSDPAKYVSGPVLVLGGGTSAAEAVLAISGAKIAAEESCAVYWSFRGTKMPRVSKALAEQFFEAYIGNGNIRSLPDSEPVSVVKGHDQTEVVSIRVDRKTAAGRPSETTHLEFAKTNCIACIGEDIPEALLKTLGVDMVVVGGGGSAQNTAVQIKKMMAVTPLLETQQPNVYLIGDLLSQSYLETDDFSAPIETFRQVKHRGNIKTSITDGVFIAEVIRQRLDGKKPVVEVRPAQAVAVTPNEARVAAVVGRTGEAGDKSTESPADRSAADPFGGSLVLMTPAGIEAGEFRLKAEGTTTIGRVDRDIVFPEDTFLSESHASISVRDGQYVLRDDGSRAGTYLRVRSDKPMRVRDGSLIRAGHQILVVSAHTRGEPPHVEHYDANGTQIGAYPLRDTTVFGRSGGRSDPNVVLDDGDHTLSRFHMAVIVDHDGIWVQDFGSRNGTYVKVDDQQPIEHGDIIRIGSQQLEVRLREELPEKKSSKPVVAPPPPSVQDVPPPPPPAPARPAAAAAAAVASGPHVSFAGQNKGGPIDPSESLLKWADEHEVSIDYECWIGMCGCDAIRIVSGQEHLNPVTEKEIKTLKRRNLEPGKCRLACMTKASGPVVVEVV